MEGRFPWSGHVEYNYIILSGIGVVPRAKKSEEISWNYGIGSDCVDIESSVNYST